MNNFEIGKPVYAVVNPFGNKIVFTENPPWHDDNLEGWMVHLVGYTGEFGSLIINQPCTPMGRVQKDEEI